MHPWGCVATVNKIEVQNNIIFPKGKGWFNVTGWTCSNRVSRATDTTKKMETEQTTLKSVYAPKNAWYRKGSRLSVCPVEYLVASMN